jgi:hypothetical protein
MMLLLCYGCLVCVFVFCLIAQLFDNCTSAAKLSYKMYLMSFGRFTTTLALTQTSTTKHLRKFGKVNATTKNQNDDENQNPNPSSFKRSMD